MEKTIDFGTAANQTKVESTDAPLVTVRMDGEETTSDDFVAIVAKPDGSIGIYYNTDTLTLGIASKMVMRAFVKSTTYLTEEEYAEISSILGNEPEVSEGHE